MVSTSSSQQTIYRSVPPRPLSYGLSDMLDPRVLGYMAARHRSSTAPVSGNTPEEFAHRFKSRPTTRPRVIKFDGSTVTPKGHHHHSVAVAGMSNGFPTARAKIYIGQPKARSPSEHPEQQPINASTSRSPYSSGRVQLLTPLHTSPGILVGGTGGGASVVSHAQSNCHTPASPAPLPAAHITHKALQGGQQNHSHARSDRAGATTSASNTGSAKTSHHRANSSANGEVKAMLSKSASSVDQKGEINGWRSSSAAVLKPSDSLRDTSHSTELSASIPRDLQYEFDHIHNPELLLTSSADCDDLCALPPPKKVLPKREVPWVFRYKVKRGMNTLSRIMASKPSQGLRIPGKAFT